MLWGNNVSVWYLDEAYIGNSRYIYKLSVYKLLRKTLLGSFPVFTPYVLFFRFLKTFVDDELKCFKKPVRNFPFSRYITVHSN